MKNERIQSEAFIHAATYQCEDFAVVLVARSIQELAAAWRAFAESKLNLGHVEKVEILPQ